MLAGIDLGTGGAFAHRASARSTEAPWKEFVRAPLFPLAVAATVGLIVDRYFGTGQTTNLAVAGCGLIGWCYSLMRAKPIPALLWLSVAALAAAHHHAHRNSFDANDIGEFAHAEPRLVRMRAMLNEDPTSRNIVKTDPLEPKSRPNTDVVILRVTAIANLQDDWVPASGLARLTVEREAETHGQPPLAGLQAGDGVDLVGMLFQPRAPANPGELDYAEALRDRRIRAEVRISDSTASLTRLEADELSFAGQVAKLRRHATRSLHEHLPPQEAGTAVALLLGDGSAMDRTEWDVYVRTGVVHALAISGQHLAVLAGFLWLVLRLMGVRRSRGAWIVFLVIVAYTVLTGMRPSGVRAAVMVSAICGAWILQRKPMLANSFALGWLVVIGLDPTDPFSLGCQLSFLSVFVLIWGIGRWVQTDPATVEDQLINETRPIWLRVLRLLFRFVLFSYLVGLVILLANAPLVIAKQNLISPIGILIGPPIVFLTTLALLAGFLLLIFAPFGPLAVPFALITQYSLRACESLVLIGDSAPYGSIYLPALPDWWLLGFYAALFYRILGERESWNRAAMALSLWVLIACLVPFQSNRSDELRVTFLAIGHGGCAVIETPDGRCLIYDIGATAGPGAVRRVIAPFLWHRRIRRVDELFVSHADADHFNGVDELLRRFPVGQVTLTPSFAERPTEEVSAILVALDRHRVPRRIAVRGDQFQAGDVEIHVLHPPRVGPPGIENERSLVLQVCHAGHSILLTGDLERMGTTLFLQQELGKCDVLVAPHHGSRSALPIAFVKVINPRLVVVSRGPNRGNTIAEGAAGEDVPIWDTASQGAITLRSHKTGLVAESVRTTRQHVVSRKAP